MGYYRKDWSAVGKTFWLLIFNVLMLACYVSYYKQCKELNGADRFYAPWIGMGTDRCKNHYSSCKSDTYIACYSIILVTGALGFCILCSNSVTLSKVYAC